MKALTRIACVPLVIVGQLYILIIFAVCCLYATCKWTFDKKD